MEIQIRDQLNDELADSDAPPIGALVTDAAATGRRLRRRRQLAATSSAAATVVVVASAGVLALSNLDGGARVPAQTGGPGKPTPTATVSVAPSRPTPPGHAVTSGAAVVALLRDLLPGGEVSEIDFEDAAGYAAGYFVYDDGNGAATVAAGVADRPGEYGPTATGMQCPPNPAGFVCEYSTTPDGFEVRVMTMGPHGGACAEPKCSIKHVRVEVRRPDGVCVTAEAYNGPFGRNRPATRNDTVLSVAQLTTIAKNPRWGLTMDATFVMEAEHAIRRSGG